MGSGSAPSQQKSAAEETMGVRAGMEFNDYQARYVPFENRYIDYINTLDAPWRKEQLAGMANADTTQAFAGNNEAIINSGLASGANVGSGKMQMGLAANKDAHATAMGLGMGDAARSAEDNRAQGLLKMAAFGRGLADTSTMNLGKGAQLAQARAKNAAAIGASNNAFNSDIANGFAGMAVNSYYKAPAAAGSASEWDQFDTADFSRLNNGGISAGWGG